MPITHLVWPTRGAVANRPVFCFHSWQNLIDLAALECHSGQVINLVISIFSGPGIQSPCEIPSPSVFTSPGNPPSRSITADQQPPFTPLRSLQRHPQAPHLKSKFLATRPAGRSGPTAGSGASRQKQIPSSPPPGRARGKTSMKRSSALQFHKRVQSSTELMFPS